MLPLICVFSKNQPNKMRWAKYLAGLNHSGLQIPFLMKSLRFKSMWKTQYQWT